MKLRTFRLRAQCLIVSGVLGIFGSWYLSFAGIALALGALLFMLPLKKQYTQDPFKFSQPYAILKIAFVLNLIALFLALFFTIIYAHIGS